VAINESPDILNSFYPLFPYQRFGFFLPRYTFKYKSSAAESVA